MRDLLIEHLRSDSDARNQFLRNCSMRGAELALSIAGGTAGSLAFPLLIADRDWELLGARLCGSGPEQRAREFLWVSDALSTALAFSATNTGEANVDAKARLEVLTAKYLALVCSDWNQSDSAIPTVRLRGFAVMREYTDPRVEWPELERTWASLAIDIEESFNDWDAADLLEIEPWTDFVRLTKTYCPEWLKVKGWPQRFKTVISNYCDHVEWLAEQHSELEPVDESEQSEVREFIENYDSSEADEIDELSDIISAAELILHITGSESLELRMETVIDELGNQVYIREERRSLHESLTEGEPPDYDDDRPRGNATQFVSVDALFEDL